MIISTKAKSTYQSLISKMYPINKGTLELLSSPSLKERSKGVQQLGRLNVPIKNITEYLRVRCYDRNVGVLFKDIIKVARDRNLTDPHTAATIIRVLSDPDKDPFRRIDHNDKNIIEYFDLPGLKRTSTSKEIDRILKGKFSLKDLASMPINKSSLSPANLLGIGHKDMLSSPLLNYLDLIFHCQRMALIIMMKRFRAASEKDYGRLIAENLPEFRDFNINFLQESINHKENPGEALAAAFVLEQSGREDLVKNILDKNSNDVQRFMVCQKHLQKGIMHYLNISYSTIPFLLEDAHTNIWGAFYDVSKFQAYTIAAYNYFSYLNEKSQANEPIKPLLIIFLGALQKEMENMSIFLKNSALSIIDKYDIGNIRRVGLAEKMIGETSFTVEMLERELRSREPERMHKALDLIHNLDNHDSSHYDLNKYRKMSHELKLIDTIIETCLVDPPDLDIAAKTIFMFWSFFLRMISTPHDPIIRKIYMKYFSIFVKPENLSYFGSISEKEAEAGTIDIISSNKAYFYKEWGKNKSKIKNIAINLSQIFFCGSWINLCNNPSSIKEVEKLIKKDVKNITLKKLLINNIRHLQNRTYDTELGLDYRR